MKPLIDESFLKAYEQYSNDISRYCYYRVFDREKVKDIVQETYCRAWNYLRAGKKIQNIRAFLYKTAYHIIVDDSRKNKSFSLNAMMDKGFAPNVDPRGDMEHRFGDSQVIQLVQRLDERYRQVIMLKYVDDLSAKEIAAILNETENNVYVRISRGFKKIRTLSATHA